MEPVSIGEAAARLGTSLSALRYYDQRSVAPPARREYGQRRYDRDELRRLALLKLFRELGLPLDTAAAVLDAAPEQRRAELRDQLDALDELIARAHGARSFVQAALDRPADHPASRCTAMTAALDHLLDGGTVVELAGRAPAQLPS